MKRNILSSLLKGLLCYLMVITLFGCEKAPVNNQLEQHWQLLEITKLETNETEQCYRKYYGITRMVTQVAYKLGHKPDTSYIARTIYEGDNTLILRDFKVSKFNTDKKIDATSEQLKPFGIIDPKETVFQIVKLTNRELILESNYARLRFRKF